MQVLGVTFWLDDFWSGSTIVANRQSRVERILEMLKSYVSRGSVTPGEAATMHGLLNYAGGFVVGRCLKPAARYFASMTMGSSDKEKVSKVCSDTIQLLEAMKPRVIRSLKTCQPAIIYTDEHLRMEKERGEQSSSSLNRRSIRYIGDQSVPNF